MIAGVDPNVGLYAAFAGGRSGIISAATGAMELVMVTLVREHGLQYLPSATLLTGLPQMLAGVLRIGRHMRFMSRSEVTGFVNALAILILLAQMPEITGENARPLVLGTVLVGLAMIRSCTV